MQEQVAGLRRFGAAALDLAWVAAGRLDGYWERNLKPWDMAAGLILVREAGGFVTDCDGGDDMFAKGHIVAGNETIQKELLRVLKTRPRPATRQILKRRSDAISTHSPVYPCGFRHSCFFLVTGLWHIESARFGPALTFRKLMAKELDPLKLSSPRIFLLRMLVFVVLGGLVAFVLHKQIEVAFMANPGLNALIIGVLVIGIVLCAAPGDAALSGDRLGQQFPPRRSRPRGRAAAGAAGADGGDPRQPRRPHGDVGAIDARHSRLDRHPPRRGARHLALHDRPAGVPRPARHLLGPDRDGQLGRRRHPGAESRRRRRLACSTRCAKASPRRSPAWAFRFRPRCSASPARWCSASSICNRARRRTASTPSWKTGSPPPSTTRPAEPIVAGGGTGEMRSAIDRLREARQRGRRQQGRLHRHVQSGRGDPGPGAPHAHRAADDPRLGRQPGRAAARDQAAAGDHGARESGSVQFRVTGFGQVS